MRDEEEVSNDNNEELDDDSDDDDDDDDDNNSFIKNDHDCLFEDKNVTLFGRRKSFLLAWS